MSRYRKSLLADDRHREAFEKVNGATLQLRELGYTATADEGAEGLAHYEAMIERLRLDVARAESLERIAARVRGGFVAYDPKLAPPACVLEAQIALQELLDLAKERACERDPDCIHPQGHDGPCEDEVGFRA